VVEKAETKIIMELMEPLILAVVVEVLPEWILQVVLVALVVQVTHKLRIGVNYGTTLCIS
jgi:hypothetical protein